MKQDALLAQDELHKAHQNLSRAAEAKGPNDGTLHGDALAAPEKKKHKKKKSKGGASPGPSSNGATTN